MKAPKPSGAEAGLGAAGGVDRACLSGLGTFPAGPSTVYVAEWHAALLPG